MCVLAVLLFLYHHYVEYRWSWDLAAVVTRFIVTTWSLMLWYLRTS
jgi:hypothetical protein